MNATIEPATADDVPTLLELIRELARYERLEHEMEATASGLQKALFGQQPLAGALLAREGAKVAGYALYFSTFCTFAGKPGLWLEDLFVRPEFRGHGHGRALLMAVARVAHERNCGRFEWTALNWNKPALEFYRRLGAETMDEWMLLRLNPAGLKRLAESG